MSSDRKASYKAPPGAVTDVHLSQQARRAKALEHQKRRRAQRFDASRQLDLFANLSLGHSDDEADEDGEDDVVREGVASFASMLPGPNETASTSATAIEQPPESIPKEKTSKKKGKKRKAKGKSRKPNKWADKCMYAELLEMNEDSSLSDGLPADLETGWVAVAPVPVGKRCLAVTHESLGIPSAGPNTTLRSRLLGKSLLPPFPSSLPPSTILDCILDPHWVENGIVHVLDVIQWKGQDVGDCETAFRFWWRDTRLSELPPVPIPPSAPPPQRTPETLVPYYASDISHYRFPYPTTLLPIPYHPDTSLLSLAANIIPQARQPRLISITLPMLHHKPASAEAILESQMDIDTPSGQSEDLLPAANSLHSVSFEIAPDGLLLYVAQASYEPGTSPLSSWVPIRACDGDSAQLHAPGADIFSVGGKGTLDVFERLVMRRLVANARQTDMNNRQGVNVPREMDMDSGT